MGTYWFICESDAPAAEIFKAERSGNFSVAKTPKAGRGRQSMSGYVKGRIDDSLALGTLAAKTLVSSTLGSVMSESGRISSADLTWSMNDFVDAVGDGPIFVGVAHSDYSDAEIEASIEASSSWDRGDKIQRELAQRLVRTIGSFSTTGVTLSVDVLNDGRPIKTKLNWGLTTGDTLKIWAYNAGSSALGTGASVFVLGHANLFIKY